MADKKRNMLLVAVEMKPYRYHDAERIVSKIREHTDHGAEVIHMVWLLGTNDSTAKWTKRLRPLLKKDDALFIVKTKGDYNGFLGKSVWEWLRSSCELGIIKGWKPPSTQ
jgi:hypothetical protein